MLLPRIIPCLLIHNKGLVKTVNFKNPVYVGDPINAVKIFNEKEADEIMILDIDASVNKSEPDFKLIEKLAMECRMPLAYGGGIHTAGQAQTIFSLGVEKICLSAAAIGNPSLVSEIAEIVGVQSTVVVLDVKKKFFGGYEVYSHNGKISTGRDPLSLAKIFVEKGAGEIIINSIDRDGTMKGYDLDLISEFKDKVSTPITFLGGAGALEDLRKVIENMGTIGVAAGSLFVFKGKYKAVLINYPSFQEKMNLFY